MRIDTHIARRTRQALSFSIRDMLLCFRISILLGHSEVDDMNYIRSFCAWSTDEEIIRLDISIDKILFVDGLYACELR